MALEVKSIDGDVLDTNRGRFMLTDFDTDELACIRNTLMCKLEEIQPVVDWQSKLSQMIHRIDGELKNNTQRKGEVCGRN